MSSSFLPPSSSHSTETCHFTFLFLDATCFESTSQHIFNKYYLLLVAFCWAEGGNAWNDSKKVNSKLTGYAEIRLVEYNLTDKMAT